MVTVGTHVRPLTDDHPPGIYRVVGATDSVVLLRVADGTGNRIHSGTVRSVSAETVASDFEPAPDPDAGIQPIQTARSALTGLYWSLRGLL